MSEIKCPNCGSLNAIDHGYQHGIPTYRCGDCKTFWGQPGWHTPKLCENIADSFSVEEIAELKAEINSVFQRFFTFRKAEKILTPQDLVSQYHDNPVSQSRIGDPEGFFGKVFKKARGFYHGLENKPIAEAMWFWAAFDWIVLSCSKSKVASRYRDALWVHYRDLLRTYFSKR